MRVFTLFTFLFALSLSSCSEDSKNNRLQADRISKFLFEKIEVPSYLESIEETSVDSILQIGKNTVDIFKKFEYLNLASILFYNQGDIKLANTYFKPVSNLGIRAISDKQKQIDANYFLALSYMRLSSSRADISSNNYKLPLSNTNELVNEAFIEKAIALLVKVLKQDSTHHKARALLNYACMNLGAVPTSVPGDLLIEKK